MDPWLGTENLLLRCLSTADRRHLLAGARRIPLIPHRILIRPGHEFHSVYFPLGGTISMVTELGDGSTVQVAIVGIEGVVGARPILVGRGAFPNMRAQVQDRGDALAVPDADFHDALERSPTLRMWIERFLDVQFTRAVQELACLRAHPTDQRLARWLVLAHDRSAEPGFSMTQEFMSRMLGVRRATVTDALGRLGANGLVETRRGGGTILNRPGLEARACECYTLISGELRTFMRACIEAEPGSAGDASL